MSASSSEINLHEFGLRIDSIDVNRLATNFRPPSWPPPDSWPVVVDASGEVVSRYGDPIWRLDLWARRPVRLNFEDGSESCSSNSIVSFNANLLRLAVAFWIWGPFAAFSCSSVASKFQVIKRVFVYCSQQGIRASDLMQFPLVAEQLPTLITSSRIQVSVFLNSLHDLYEHREFLGYTLLDKEGLRHLAKALPEPRDHQQRAYIPPRIWSYQVTQLRKCLDDYLKHQEQIENCYQFCLDAYAHNAEALGGPTSVKLIANYAPFRSESYYIKKNPKLKFYGPFEITAALFGVHELLERWSGPLNDGESHSGVCRLTDYLNLVTIAGLAYILNFSLMRAHEAWGLRADCLLVERDERYGDIYILRGETTKTQKDSDARWTTSPSVKTAVEAMTGIAHLRLRCTSERRRLSKFQEDLNNPHLIGRGYEPWITKKGSNVRSRHQYPSYQNSRLAGNPLLWDLDVLRITAEDLTLARQITPSIDTEKFKVGDLWPFSWHQLRRTGAVNMQSSGLVSDFSLQGLLKHATLPMCLYYGQNHSRLRLNQAARSTFLKAMYEVVGHEINRLADRRFVSPHGEMRKTEVLQLISPKDVKDLVKAAEKGEVTAPREIILGYCVNREICPWGGIDSIAHCGGGDSDAPCLHVLYDVKKIDIVKKLDGWIDQQLQEAPNGSPLWQSLECQKRSAKNYLEACATS